MTVQEWEKDFYGNNVTITKSLILKKRCASCTLISINPPLQNFLATQLL